MCYLGNQGTFTPCHKDLCGSSGHNIMCHTEDGGHSLWYMMASHDALAVDDYFRNCIGKELDWEEHVATEEEFASAPFTVYVAEQRLGDLILIPPRSCHQVVNRGGLTVKNSWSRMTVEGLKVALHHELPIYRRFVLFSVCLRTSSSLSRVCRPELYRIRNILHRSLLHFTEVLKRYKPSVLRPSPSENDVEILSKLFELFDFVLLQEFSTDHASLPHVVPPGAHLPHPTDNSESIPFNSIRSVFSGSRLIQEDLTMGNNKPASYFMCDFCGADIFQSFFECHECATSDTTKNVGDGLIICPPCYAEGRTCRCGNMVAIQLRPFDELLQARNGALGVLLDHTRGEELTRLHEKG